jgi:hypothetical protein
MSILSAKNRDLWAATLVGAVVAGVLTAFLEAAGLIGPYSDVLGALVGGAAAAYVLYGKVSQAVGAGALSGVLGLPFYLGMSEILYIWGLIPIPSGPTPSLAVLQTAVVLILGVDVVAGLVGGLIVGGVRHPREEVTVPQPQGIPPLSVPQNKYCVQCGAQLPSGALVCPHCGARQP